MADLHMIMQKITDLNLSLTTAESLTGGLLAGKLIEFPGASNAIKECFVTYSNEAKHRRLGVKEETLDQVGAVSAECAAQMAEGAALLSESDIALSTTGFAGPGCGGKDKPVGLVYIGICYKGVTHTHECHFKGERNEIRKQTVEKALEILKEEIGL